MLVHSHRERSACGGSCRVVTSSRHLDGVGSRRSGRLAHCNCGRAARRVVIGVATIRHRQRVGCPSSQGIGGNRNRRCTARESAAGRVASTGQGDGSSRSRAGACYSDRD